MSKELQNCRFCGGEGFIAVIDENAFVASCRDCGIHTQVQTSRERAIALWNRRPSPWHTGTPTEEGWYVCKLAGSDIYETHNFTGNNWDETLFEKWQMI